MSQPQDDAIQNEHQPPSLRPAHSPWCSAFAGALRGVGNAVLGSEGIEVVKHTLEHGGSAVPTSFSLWQVSRTTVPGFLAFETHHTVARGLLQWRQAPSESSLGSTAKHMLHFVAGSAGGFSYGLALQGLEALEKQGLKGISSGSLFKHSISHGALFGGFDCCMDLIPKLVDKGLADSDAHTRRVISVGISGGCAGVIQHVVGKALSFSSLKWKPALLAFGPGFLAFVAYEYTTILLGTGHH